MITLRSLQIVHQSIKLPNKLLSAFRVFIELFLTGNSRKPNEDASNGKQPIRTAGIVPLDKLPANENDPRICALSSLFLTPILFLSGTFSSLSLSAVGLVPRRTCGFYLLSFSTFAIVYFHKMAEEAPTLKRDSTMAVTAKVSPKSTAREQEKYL